MKKNTTYKRRLSPSSINTYRRCPRQYYYSYILKIPTRPSIHLLKGSIIHRVLENLFLKYKTSDLKGEAFELLDKFWNVKCLKLDEKEEEKEKDDSRRIISRAVYEMKKTMSDIIFAGKAENDRHAFYLLRPKFKEKRYFCERLNIAGIIDRIDKDFEGNIILGDYKTGGKYGITLDEDYKRQLGIYALMYKECEGITADWICVRFIRYGETYYIEVTPSLLKFAENEIKEIHSLTKSDEIEEYPQKESKLCSYCDFQDVCVGERDVKSDQKLLEAFSEK